MNSSISSAYAGVLILILIAVPLLVLLCCHFYCRCGRNKKVSKNGCESQPNNGDTVIVVPDSPQSYSNEPEYYADADELCCSWNFSKCWMKLYCTKCANGGGECGDGGGSGYYGGGDGGGYDFGGGCDSGGGGDCGGGDGGGGD